MSASDDLNKALSSASASVAAAQTALAAAQAAAKAMQKPAPAPPPPPPPPPGPTLTTITDTTGSVKDGHGDVFALVAGAAGVGFQITRNGTLMPETNGVTLGTIVNGVFWQQAHNLWWSWEGNAWVYHAAIGPTPPPQAPAPPPPPPNQPPPPPPAAGRNWAFIMNEGGEPGNWAAVNSGWSLQPMDGLHIQTDIGDAYWFGTGKTWSPTPRMLMMSNQYGTPGHDFIDMGQAAQEAYNATWLSWLKSAAAAAPAPIKVVRIWQEINGNWMPWSVNQTGATSVDGTPNGAPWPAATIIAAFRNMAAQVRAALPNALIEWNLNAAGPWSGPSGPGNGTGFDLYPGDAYVDVIGLDSYEKNTSWADTVSGHGVNLNDLVAFANAHNKLVGISETAAHNGDGSYLTSMTSYFDGLGSRAAYISYYDQGLSNNGDNIIYSTTGTDSAPALRDALNASSFGKKPYTGNLSPAPTAPPPPPQAAAAGFTKPTFFDDFDDLGSIDLKNTGAPQCKWSIQQAFGGGTVDPATITLSAPSVLRLTSGDQFSNSAIMTWHPGFNLFTSIFGYTAFRARFLGTDEAGPGWPSAWRFSKHHLDTNNSDRWFEMDTIERFKWNAITAHDWGSQANGGAGHLQTDNSIPGIGWADPAGWDKTQWHIYGDLHEDLGHGRGRLSWWLDDKFVKGFTYGPNEVPAWFDPSNADQPASKRQALDGAKVGAFSIAYTDAMVLILGTGPNQPMEVDWAVHYDK